MIIGSLGIWFYMGGFRGLFWLEFGFLIWMGWDLDYYNDIILMIADFFSDDLCWIYHIFFYGRIYLDWFFDFRGRFIIGADFYFGIWIDVISGLWDWFYFYIIAHPQFGSWGYGGYFNFFYLWLMGELCELLGLISSWDFFYLFLMIWIFEALVNWSGSGWWFWWFYGYRFYFIWFIWWWDVFLMNFWVFFWDLICVWIWLSDWMDRGLFSFNYMFWSIIYDLDFLWMIFDFGFFFDYMSFFFWIFFWMDDIFIWSGIVWVFCWWLMMIFGIFVWDQLLRVWGWF